MKRVLITGASSGIGLQLARDYCADGWEVIACGRDQSKMHQVLGDLSVMYCVFDTTDRDQTRRALSEVATPDLVILNAGSCEYIDDAKAFDAELFDRVFSINVMGTVNCLSALLPKMAAGSRVAIVSSSVTFLPLTRAEAYGASKAALDYLARTLAVDLSASGIAVSLVRPGFVDTPLTRRNDFPMPGRVSVETASRIIRQGLARGKAEINFPFVFISIMRLLAMLPNTVWQLIATRMARSTA